MGKWERMVGRGGGERKVPWRGGVEERRCGIRCVREGRVWMVVENMISSISDEDSRDLRVINKR